MSEPPAKRPTGTRDISELKARLGLSSDRAKRPSGLGGVVAPPGAAQPPLPSPPGAAPPFDAMMPPRAMARDSATHASTYAREPVYADHGPVASLEKKGMGKTLAKLAGIAVIPLALGVAIGSIGSSAKVYNATIRDAGKILTDVQAVSGALVSTQQAFERARDRAEKAGSKTYLRNDMALVEELQKLPNVQPNLQIVYSSYLYELPTEVVGETLEFYHGVAHLQTLLKKHIEVTKSSANALQLGQSNWEQLMRASPLAALLEMPKGNDTLPSIKLVQLGPPICPGSNSPNPKGCGDGVTPVESEFRTSYESGWSRRVVAKVEGETVSGNSILPVNIDTKVFTQLIRGGEATVAEVAYDNRLTQIDEELAKLMELRARVVDKLTVKARESKRFSFFL